MTAPRFDIIAIGNAIVDVLARADDALIEAEGLTKGSMRLIDGDEAERLYAAMGPAVEVSGGSAANTLAGMAADLWYLGEREDLAAALKLFGNSMLFAMTGGIADILAMAKNLHVDPVEAIGVFTRFNAAAALTGRAQKIAHGDFSASFELTMARKDARLMIETAAQAGQHLGVLPAIAQRMDELIARGYGAADVGVLAIDAVPQTSPSNPPNPPSPPNLSTQAAERPKSP